MTLVTRRPWPLLHPDSREQRDLPPGEHAVELRTVWLDRIGQSCTWLCLPGEPWGASFGSWIQWAPGRPGFGGSPIDWGEFEVRVYDDEGRLLGVDGAPITEPEAV